MSLIEQFSEEFSILEKTREPDGEGGFIVSWADGAVIKVAQRFDSTMEARRAEKEGVTSVYTFLVNKSVKLEYHDVLKRLKDGQIFRITSNAGDSYTPASSGLDMTAVTAEKWELTS